MLQCTAQSLLTMVNSGHLGQLALPLLLTFCMLALPLLGPSNSMQQDLLQRSDDEIGWQVLFNSV
jgi:hypothetical protein